jgi:hypothetical protein
MYQNVSQFIFLSQRNKVFDIYPILVHWRRNEA